MSNTFPTILNDWDSGEVIESAWADALEAKIGIDNSAVATSLDYLIKHTSSKLGAIASLAVTDGNIIVGNGTNWVAESGATARTSLGLGTGDSPTLSKIILASDGTAKSTVDFLTLTNTVNNADMDATGTGILFNQWYYDASTPAIADSGRIAMVTETDWTSTASTQDSAMLFMTSLDGTVAERMRIDSAGNVGIGTTPAAYERLVAKNCPWSSNTSRAISGYCPDLAVDADATNYGVAVYSKVGDANIASTKTDSGYRVASYNDALINDADFEGTLNGLYGVFAQAGIYTGTGTLTNSYSCYVMRYGATGTITNSYGLYIAAPGTGGTMTNQWALYSADTANSYFAGNVGIGTSTFGANAATVLGIANGTAPAAHVDNSIQIYSVDTADNTATLGLMLEQAVEAIGTFTASHKIKVLINGTAYWIELDAV